MEKFETIAEGFGGSEGRPGDQYRLIRVKIAQRGDMYRATIVETSGSNQGRLEEHARSAVSARSNTWEAAIEIAQDRAREADMDLKILVEAISAAEDEMDDVE